MEATRELSSQPPTFSSAPETAPQPNLLKPPSRGIGSWMRRLIEWLNIKGEQETGLTTLEQTGLIPKEGDYPDPAPKK